MSVMLFRAGYRCGLVVAAAVFVAAATGCFDERERPTVPIFGELVVLSDPEGADIILDEQELGVTTPATLFEIPAGEHRLDLELRAGVEFYRWRDSVSVPEEAVDTVEAALQGGCTRDCGFLVDRGRIECRSNSNGDTCAGVFYETEPALLWPEPSGGAYTGGGRLLIAARIAEGAGPQTGDTISTLVFRQSWIGRRPVEQTSSDRLETMNLEYWGTATFPGEAVTGLSVRETLLAVDSADVEDVLFLHFEIENVSADERYRRLYPWVPDSGYTFDGLYVGFGFDADVGAPEDDLGTFDPDLDLAFMYDADFQDEELGEFSERPALAGLVTVEPPAGATERTFTLWRREDDWDNGTFHGFAWRLLAGRLGPGDAISDHPSPDIGHTSDAPDDYRLIDAHGPLRIAPGESVTMTVAIVMAEPVPGTFTPGTLIPAGDPTDPGRAILDVAADLRELAAQVPELWSRYRP
jgi:hypothetical protein